VKVVYATLVVVRANDCGGDWMGDRRTSGRRAGVSGRLARHHNSRIGHPLVALNVELDTDSPAWSATLLRRQYEQTFEGTTEERFERWAARVDRNKWLYIARTIGIAAILIGLNMFIAHQL